MAPKLPRGLLLLLISARFVPGAGRARPHILYILADDFGWGNADWHRSSRGETATPFLSSLVHHGVELERMYSYKFCSPSRSAIQSGRNPIHVNVQNLDPTYVNRADALAGYAGIPKEMTGLGSLMKSAGYATHFVGKWDAGMATPDHTPRGRGYDTSLLFFHHVNDYWDSRFYGSSAAVGSSTSVCKGHGDVAEWRPVDLWQGDAGAEGPARGRNNSLEACTIATEQYCTASLDTPEAASRDCPAFPADASGECAYEDGLFEEEVRKHIMQHNTSEPMFLFWALHVVHAPLQVPKRFLDLYRHVATDDWRRQRYLAMTRYMDSAVENVTAVLRERGMYNDTLIVFSSDNGGPIYKNGTAAASNWPLRGGKASNWEGGIRVNAFASGGFLPVKARGRRLDGLAAVWDWYGTFAGMAGVDPFDHRADAASLPPVDSVNLWPYLSGATAASPRTSLALGSSTCVVPSAGCINEWGDAPSSTLVEGLIVDERAGGGGLWKVLLGRIAMDGWQGPLFPNASTLSWPAENYIADCEAGCLFEIGEDPTEHSDVAGAFPERVQQMLQALRAHNRTAFSPDRGEPDIEGACQAAMTRYAGFWGPWLDLAEGPASRLV